MIYQLISRLKYILKNSADLTEVQEVKEVDDLETYDAFVSKYPCILIARTDGELFDYRSDTKATQHVFSTIDVRTVIRYEGSPEAARKVLDILTWKVVQVLRANRVLEVANYLPLKYLIDSEINSISYGSKKKDKVYDEYSTIKFFTWRPEEAPVPDDTYYDVINTILRVNTTGG